MFIDHFSCLLRYKMLTLFTVNNHAYSYEKENLNIAVAVSRASELRTIQATIAEIAPESSMRKQSSGTFQPTEDTKVVQINLDDASKTVQIGYGLSSK
jgi:hypothetical protein